MLEYLVLDAQDGSRTTRLSSAPLREFFARQLVMPRIPVGHRQKLNRVATRTPESGGAAGVDVAVVRVRADNQDFQLFFLLFFFFRVFPDFPDDLPLKENVDFTVTVSVFVGRLRTSRAFFTFFPNAAGSNERVT